MASTNRQELATLIPRIGEHVSELRSQCLDVRLHPCASSSFRPEEFFSKSRRPRPFPLRPRDEGFTQYPFPLSQRTPDVAIGDPEVRSRVPDGAPFDEGTQQLKKRIVQDRAVLFPRLIAVAQMHCCAGSLCAAARTARNLRRHAISVLR